MGAACTWHATVTVVVVQGFRAVTRVQASLGSLYQLMHGTNGSLQTAPYVIGTVSVSLFAFVIVVIAATCDGHTLRVGMEFCKHPGTGKAVLFLTKPGMCCEAGSGLFFACKHAHAPSQRLSPEWNAL